MAITYFASASNPADNGSLSAATIAVTPPASMVAGDLAIIVAESRNTGDVLTISQASGQTWTTESAQVGTSQVIRIFWCRFNGTWGADPSVATFTTTASNPGTVVMRVFRPTNSADTWAIDVARTGGTITAPSSPFDVTITGITTLTDGALVFALWAVRAANTWVLQTGGWTNAGTAQYRNTSGSAQSQSVAYLVKSPAGGTGDVTNRESAGTAGAYSILAWKEVEGAEEISRRNLAYDRP